jgi:acetyl esterase
MSVFGAPRVATAVARMMQAAVAVTERPFTRRRAALFPDLRADTAHVTIPTAVAPARAVVYRPVNAGPNPPVHVNFHGGGFVMRGAWMDDPLCRCLAAEAGVVVVNVDYVVAPRHRFPAPVDQGFEVVRWVAGHGADHGWDGSLLTVGGQSAGGALTAAVARLALEQGGPPIALQVLHYAPLDLATPSRDKPAAIAKPMLRPWLGDVFDSAYVPDRRVRTNRLVSPAGSADTADLTGIAPALVITAAFDRLNAEGVRYAERLRAAGALVDHHDVAGVDHGYDMSDPEQARRTYTLIARHVRDAG